MRSLYVGLIGLALVTASSAAQAKIAITVDKDAQQLTVVQDGVEKYRWPVSSGLPAYETPNGSFQTFRMEQDHYSKEFDEAPMPNSIFFTKRGHAIHGTDSVSRLGTPASHGCVRLSRENAATLFAMVKADGVLNTTVTLTGSSTVALARNPRPAKPAAVARRQVVPAEPSYDAAGNPVELVPQPALPSRRVVRQAAPQLADDGYIYPADGSNADQRYPAPRGYRRMTEAETQQYYASRGYAQPQYQQQYYAPRPYQPRGLFGGYQD
jgi:hypothetical protein